MPSLYVVIGPPGCGKTSYVADRATEAAARFGGGRVLICSLTKAAAVEAGRREIPLDSGQIGTMHSHCLRALGYPPLATGKRLAEWNEFTAKRGKPWMALEATGEVSDDLESIPERDDVLEAYTTLRATMVDREKWPKPVGEFAELWEEWKAAAGLCDFQDLIEDCYSQKKNPLGDPHVIYLDEAQDSSAMELALALQWGRVANLVIVGDPDQSIFQWRGACPGEFKRLGDANPDRLKVLSQSYRVPRAVHARAVDWIRRITTRIDARYEPTDEPGEVCDLDDVKICDGESLLQCIEADVAQGMTVMVLAACSYMLAPLVEEMRRQGVPFHNPFKPQHGGWNPLGSAKSPGSAVNRIRSFLEPCGEGESWTAAGLYSWLEIADASILVRGAKAKLADIAEKQPLTLVPDSALEAIFQPGRAAEAIEAAWAGNIRWLKSNTIQSKQKSLEFPVRIVERRGLGALSEKPQIIVGTIHSVKGGEADSVYVCPDLSQNGWDSWTANEDETIRLFYVAMTRARRKLTILREKSWRAVMDL